MLEIEPASTGTNGQAIASRSASLPVDSPRRNPHALCGTKLFEECPSCHANRHSLLPACEKCGAEKVVTPSQIVGH